MTILICAEYTRRLRASSRRGTSLGIKESTLVKYLGARASVSPLGLRGKYPKRGLASILFLIRYEGQCQNQGKAFISRREQNSRKETGALGKVNIDPTRPSRE
jgi:hypothetical protein